MTTENKYYVVFDNVDGLTKSNTVFLNGLGVGRVATVEFNPEIKNKILVTLVLDRRVLLNDSTVALLTKTDLLGEKAIVLQLGQGSRTLVNRDTLIGVKEQGFTEILTERALPVVQNLDTTLINFSKLSQEYTYAGVRINKILENLIGVSADVAKITHESKSKITGILTKTDQLVLSLQEMKESLDPIIHKMAVMADTINDASLAETLDNARKASAQLDETLKKINEGQGTLGKLVNNDSLYTNLNALTMDLDKLVVDFKERPKRYVHFSVFGKKDKEKKEENKLMTFQ